MQAFEVLSSLGGVASVAEEVREVAGGVSIVVPLSRLFLSPLNVRKVRNSGSIPELAEMIEAETLLNPLCVVAEEKQNVLTGRYGVVAGGRRLQALQYLVEQKRLAADSLITCKEFHSARAVGVSLTENVAQETMHPADMAEAFKRLVDEGKSIPQIAGRFGVSELTVERRLKIANLAPMFLQLYRDGEIEPKQLQALALTNDHGKQIAAWESLPAYRRSAYHLQQALTENEMQVTDSLARFVGLEAYEQAGGAVRRDLFGDANAVFLQDTQLVQKLATERLEQAADQIRGAGWKWVEVRQEFDYQERARFTQIHAKAAKPSDAEKAGMDDLDEKLRLLQEQVRAIEDMAEAADRDMTEAESEQADALEKQIEELQDMRSEMDEALIQWGPVQLKTAGVVVTMGHGGELRIVEGLVRPEDRKAQGGSAAGAPAGAVEKAKPAFSERLMHSLTAHRTAAVAAALTDNPHVAMVALLHRLITSPDYSSGESPVRISLTDADHRVNQLATDFAETPAAATLESARERWGSKLPADSGALFRYLLAQDQGTLAELLALHVARSFDAIRGRESNSRGFDVTDAIVDALGVDMADWWTPTPAHYLDNVPKAKMIEAVTEACGEAEARDLLKMKKGEAIAAAAAKLDGKRWLPKPLHAPIAKAKEAEDESDAEANTDTE